MSVLIKGMEMPKSCILCDLSHEDGWCPVKQDYVDRYSYETCPLIPVPPHGRLIDADALDIYRREEQAQEDIDKSPFNEYIEGLKDGLHEAAKCLSTAPTVIEAEEDE